MRAQREHFRQLQSRDFNAFRMRDLLSERPELFARGFNCRSEASVPLETNDSLTAMLIGGELIIIRNGAERVGRVEDPNFEDLARAAAVCGGVPVLLDEQSVFGTFSVRLNLHSAGCGADFPRISMSCIL
jgi:hypothetical protein